MDAETLLQMIQDSAFGYNDAVFYEADKREWWVTSQWLVGSFAARAFTGETKEVAASRLSEYLDRHKGHDSLVGMAVDGSGWPDVEKVRGYVREMWSDDGDKK